MPLLRALGTHHHTIEPGVPAAPQRDCDVSAAAARVHWRSRIIIVPWPLVARRRRRALHNLREDGPRPQQQRFRQVGAAARDDWGQHFVVGFRAVGRRASPLADCRWPTAAPSRRLACLFLLQHLGLSSPPSSRACSEFFDFFKLPRNAFAKRAFAIFDSDGSGELDFREFAISLWNYCTSDKIALHSFAFDLYDVDSGGTVSADEIASPCDDHPPARPSARMHAPPMECVGADCHPLLS